MNWQYVSRKEYGYFEFAWRQYHAFYTTRKGQDFLIETTKPIFLKQIHSAAIIDVDSQKERRGDGLTSTRENALGVKVADCLPVYLFSQKRITVIHCGWRGIIAGIAKNAMKIMGGFKYVLGASIGPCCYEVQEDVAGLFEQNYKDALLMRKAKNYLDLKSAVIKDLGAERMLGSLNLCTKCHPDLFYSHRRGDAQRNYALLNRDMIDAGQRAG